MNWLRISILLLLAAACGKPVPSGEAPAPLDTGPASCLLRFQDRLEELLPAERLASRLDLPGEALRMTREEGSVSWTWPGHRVRRIAVGDVTLETPTDNQILLSPLQQLPAAQGERRLQDIRPVSDTEREERLAELKARWQDRVERQLSTLEEAQVAVELGGQELARRREVETIPDLADGARWVAHEQLLVLRHRNVLLTLYVDASDDVSENRALALALAEDILAACE